MKEKGSEVPLAGRGTICLTTCATALVWRNERKPLMSKILILFAVLCAGLSVLAAALMVLRLMTSIKTHATRLLSR